MKGQVANDTYNNDWYKKEIGASKLRQLSWYIVNVLFFVNPLNLFSGLKIRFLRLYGARVGRGVVIKPGVNIKYPWKLEIGDNSWIGEKVWIDTLAVVRIGKNVCLSQGAMLLTGNHDYTKTTFDLFINRIVLEDGVWIGAMAVVCPGVTGGSHAVLAVASVAASSLEPYGIYRGNPATFVRVRTINPNTPAAESEDIDHYRNV
jgi:putative colanic acid biosynthesis acetyltransferase WcaF